MSLAENDPSEVVEEQASDEESISEFDPYSEEAFNAVLKIDPELLRPFCFRPTWPEHTSGYTQEVTDNVNEQSRVLRLIELPQAKMSPEAIKNLVDEYPELITHVPRIEAVRKKTIIEEALARVGREQGKYSIESRNLALALGFIDHDYSSLSSNTGPEESNESVEINTSEAVPDVADTQPNLSQEIEKLDSKADTGSGKRRISEGNKEMPSQRGLEHDTNQFTPNQNQPPRLPPASPAINEADNLKCSKNLIDEAGSEEKMESVGINAPLLGKPDSGSNEIQVAERNKETVSQNIYQVPIQNQPIRSSPMSITPVPLTHNQEYNQTSPKSTKGDSEVAGKRKFPKFWRSN